MKNLRYAFLAAFALFLPSQVHAEGGYMQASVGLGSGMGDIDAPYRTAASSEVTYELDGDMAVGASLGWDLGQWAIEFKLNYIEGATEKVDQVTTTDGNEFNYAAATIGAVFQFDNLEIDKSLDIGFQPYVGLGVGYDGGYMNAQKNTESNCGIGNANSANGGCASGDDISDFDVAARASLGGVLAVHKNIGIDLNYDYIKGIADSHIASAGLRIMF